MTFIKVCGLRPTDDLHFVHAGEVTHIGVVFVPQSRRYVVPRLVPSLVSQVNGLAKVMGVFSDAPIQQLLQNLRESEVHGAQLHGQESPGTCARLQDEGFDVWKAFRVSPGESTADLLTRILPYRGVVNGILLDAASPRGVHPAVTGGHGQTFDWSILKSLELMLQGQSLPGLWVAGGLSPQNVQTLLASYVPFGVDVSSGVETNGRKDPQRISAFIEAVKQRV